MAEVAATLLAHHFCPGHAQTVIGHELDRVVLCRSETWPALKAGYLRGVFAITRKQGCSASSAAVLTLLIVIQQGSATRHFGAFLPQHTVLFRCELVSPLVITELCSHTVQYTLARRRTLPSSHNQRSQRHTTRGIFNYKGKK